MSAPPSPGDGGRATVEPAWSDLTCADVARALHEADCGCGDYGDPWTDEDDRYIRAAMKASWAIGERAEHNATTATAAADAVTEIATDRARVREQRDRALDLAEAALGAKGIYDRPRLLDELARLRRVVAGPVDTETGTDPEHPEEGR